MHAAATLYAPKELSAYADLEDMTFEQVWAEINAKNAKAQEDDENSQSIMMDLTGAHLTRSALNEILTISRLKNDHNVMIDLTGAFISDDVSADEEVVEPDEISEVAEIDEIDEI